jgi:hypothetical protein
MSTNITRAHRDAFKALTSGQYGNFAMFSCFVDGEPAVATVNEDGPGYVITPLYVSVTPGMALTDHEGVAA